LRQRLQQLESARTNLRALALDPELTLDPIDDKTIENQ
jgi:hypothetical protein